MDDNTDGFFTHDAPKFLAGFDEFSKPLSQSPGFIFHDEALDLNQDIQTQPKRRKRKVPREVPGCTTVTFDSVSNLKPKRATFEPNRRKEVAKVRTIGACIRYKQMKIAVSHPSHFVTNSYVNLARHSVLGPLHVKPVSEVAIIAVARNQNSSNLIPHRFHCAMLISMPWVRLVWYPPF